MKTFSVRLNVSNKFKDYAKSRFHIKSKNPKTTKTNKHNTTHNKQKNKSKLMTRQEIETCVCGTATVSTVCFKYQNVTMIQFKNSNKTKNIYLYLPKTKVNRKDNNTINVKCEMSFKISFQKFSSYFFFLYSTTKQTNQITTTTNHT